ncbi:MAG: bifunctional homocysteine S-methyltransferase/methylenetetrahydrofolate reductase [Candidatus Aminicenantia bacterium]
MMVNFIEILKEKVLIADGAMGTYLLEKGLPSEECKEYQNIKNPDLIFSIHKEYIEAGAEIIETNTFAANSVKLSKFNLESKIKEINQEAVRIAKEAGGKDIFVAGSVGPLGVMLRPYGIFTFNDMMKVFKEQISYLFSAGVDLLIIETISSLLEARAALLAAKSLTDEIPVIVSMTFLSDGKTKFGDELVRSLNELKEIGADVVGVNCTIGPQETSEIILPYLKESDDLFSVMPNAGYPTVVRGKIIYLSSPAYFKEYAEIYLENGANIIGSCCGTNPTHTKAIAEVVKGEKPRKRKRRIYVEVIEKEAVEEEIESTSLLREKLGQEKIFTTEIDPPKGRNYNDVINLVKKLKSLGITAVNVAENPMARMRMSSVALAHIIQERAGMEVILHFTCRDRNLLGIQSELLGASALGIRNILALRGDPAEIGDFPRATSVYDIDPVGLVRLIKEFNNGRNLAGNPIGSPTSFLVGVATNPSSPDLSAEIKRLEEKIEAGADLVLTQPQYDLFIFEKFLKEVEHFQIPLIVGILPLKSAKYAEFLHNEVPGIVIPENVLMRMKSADENKQLEVGKEIAFDFIKKILADVAGIYLIPPAQNFELIFELIEELRGNGNDS